MNWTFQNNEVLEIPDDKYIGFVYCISNLSNDKKYIGKKLFKFSKTKTVTVTLKNGTKKKKKIKVKNDSDWLDYFGSNEELKKDVEIQGRENFKREILYLCESKGDCSYLELREQIDRRVLENNEYYNFWISARVRKSHLKKV